MLSTKTAPEENWGDSRAPNEHEVHAANRIVRTIIDCGDNIEKQVRFMSFIIRDWNLDIEEQQEVIKTYERHFIRKNKQKLGSRSSTG
ncbi:MAG TPA: hypothetical protein VEP90_17870 [Methylomirabilota bacterium]|nr:hypothetical protein [Methylomirabilota bacterium]